MGVQDRDWYHDRPFRPPKRDNWRLFRGLMVAGVSALLLLFIVRQFSPGGSLERLGLSAARLQFGWPNPIQRRTHYECIVDGKVAYAGPDNCSTQMPRFQPAPPQPARVPPAVASPEPIPVPGLTKYQREMLRSADARIARDEANARADMLAMHRQAAESRSGEACAALAQEIVALDSWARQSLGGGQQDQIRARRMQVRSKQAELRC